MTGDGAARRDERDDDIIFPGTIPFILVHVAALAVVFTGVTVEAVVIGVVLYFLRIFFIGAAYHRYFSHRAYATSRWFQFVLAFMAQTTAQKSVLWWATKHRHHHLHSDTEFDTHSPRHKGFWFSHFGWIFSRAHQDFDEVKIADFYKYPELRWLDEYQTFPALVMGTICFLIAGWPGLIVGFVWSTVFVYHATFAINSVAHVFGRKRYVTGDDSRNNWILAFFTMGEGWHNNHHAFQSSVRQGFRWYEWDPTYYILRALAWTGLIWDLKAPPVAVLKNEQKLGARTIDRAAADVVASFDLETIVRGLRNAIDHAPTLTEFRRIVASAKERASEIVHTIHLPHLPSRSEIHARAVAMLARTPSIEDIVDRAHRLLIERVSARVAA
ncbi:MAG: acyl-CoA desaturase [Bauldia sp.]|nr:acyl-CoA desaturase [Bauldia sp.]